MSPLEPYQQTYTYDLGNNLTSLAHQANNDIWQQTITIHPNSNRGTENNGQNNFDANGNLLNLDNIGNLDWHYNNTLNRLTKADKSNTTQYSVYDYQGNRVRSVVEFNNQAQSQRDYLPLLDISTNETKQQSNTLHIGTHILSKSSKDNTQNPNQTHYQLTSHLQSNTLELDDKAQTLITNITTPMVALPSLRVKTKPKCNKNAIAIQAKKETTVVACPTTAPDT
ncbi:hypothetical protein BSPWISOXPB_10415 [uncultured Gammaproteobacteria bacterium]|nr:hypothetical protein BSPWISOXPB_10415 [uncultured Gammaproteobacteria bacterium]